MQDSVFLQHLPTDISFGMIHVEGGAFDMGETNEDAHNWEKPLHRVRVSAFFIGRTPVTQRLWKAVAGQQGNPQAFPGDQRPVENVSWDDITNIFLPELNRLSAGARPENMTYRLPTEAEWEFAARGGAAGEDFVYAGSDDLDAVGWYEANSNGETRPVQEKKPNALGLYDLSGNVCERCLDRFDELYFQQCLEHGIVTDPAGPDRFMNYALRAARGGNFYHDARRCRIRYRGSAPERAVSGVGFRLVLSGIAPV
ncbi:MAG: formylglycine-generating enzyme family protein [Saprospiraceae bacterium]|nr:formylglycine-generating enzyme family protein [Saprospiraceae bacterium]